MPQRHHVRVAAVQPRGYPFDSPAAVEHVCAATAEAAANGAELVIFPEAFVGGYPWGLAFGTAVGGRKPAGRRTFGRYHDAAIPVPGPETERMGRAAASGGVYLAAGVIEKGAAHSPGTSIYSPLGETVAGPLLGEEGVLYADLDLGDIARGKFDFDVIGHYARPDVFQLRVNETPTKAVG